MVDGMLKFKNCAGAEASQSVDSEHDVNMTDSFTKSLSCSQPVL